MRTRISGCRLSARPGLNVPFNFTCVESNFNLSRLELISSAFDLNVAFFVPNTIAELE